MVKFNLNLERLFFSSHDIINKLNQLSSQLDLKTPEIEAIPVKVTDNQHGNFPKSSFYGEIFKGYVKCDDVAIIYRGRKSHDIVLHYHPCDESLNFSDKSKLLNSKHITIITNNVLLIKDKETSDHSVLSEAMHNTTNLPELLKLLDDKPNELSTYITVFQSISHTQLAIWVKIMQNFNKLSDFDKVTFFITVMTAWEKFYIKPELYDFWGESFPLNFKENNFIKGNSELNRYNVPSVIQFMVYEVSKYDISSDLFIQYIIAMKKFAELSKAVFTGCEYNNPSHMHSNFLSDKMNLWINTTIKINKEELFINLTTQVGKVNLNKYQMLALTSVIDVEKISDIPTKLIKILTTPISSDQFKKTVVNN